MKSIGVRLRAVGTLALTAVLASGTGSAAAEDDPQALAKQSQNPVADLISIPFENNLYFDFGPSEELANVLNLKPVIPIGVGERINLINRFIVPLVYLEG
jgi:hypothetical protein